MQSSAYTDYFSEEGPLASILPGYEMRSSQAELAQAIERCLAKGDIGMFEAGTGTGKSLAYLVPAAKHALAGGKPIVISTYTIALQQQLLQKDIPIIQKMFPDIRASLVKGWSNYICHFRLKNIMDGSGELLFPEENDELLQIHQWAQTTDDGTSSDLPFEPRASVWDEVNAESDSCLRAQCSFYNECHFFKDRAEMENAHILVVNHHLLFADIAIRRLAGWESEQAVLPEYGAVIIDESHHVEDVATNHLGAVVSSVGVRQLIGRLLGRRGRSGLIPAWKQAMDGAGIVPQQTNDADLELCLKQVERAVDLLFQRAIAWIPPGQQGEEAMSGRIGRAMTEKWEKEIGPFITSAQTSIDELVDKLVRARRELPGGKENDRITALESQLDAVKKRLEGLINLLEQFRLPDHEERVYWVERTGIKRKNTRLVSAPIDVGESIVEWMSEACQGVVLLSATLALAGSFEHMKERLGLKQMNGPGGPLEIHERIFPSPFDYKSQSLLAATSDLPIPTHPAYAESLTRSIFEYVSASEGRALILFTSHKLLQRVKNSLISMVRDKNIPLLAQGDAPRYDLLRKFRCAENSILLGTSSFWEGVDVPGEALSLVILTRLPFDVPTEPVTEARVEKMREAGLSPFFDYSLPRAGLKLKQGFGRLVRSRHDRGVVVICDRRLIDKQYGRILVESLPPARYIVGQTEQISREIREFLTPAKAY